MTLVAKAGTISAGEPLIARVDLRIHTTGDVKLWSSGVFLDVYDAAGRPVSTMPRPRNVIDFAYGVRKVAPGETYSRFLIVTGFCQFTRPGRYTVRAQQLGPPPELPVLCEDTAFIQVLAYDSQRLEAACDGLFTPIRKHSSFGAIPMGVRTKALYSVRDDVVLPYLDWLVREWHAEYAARAIRRIGTPRADRLVAALVARGDDAGKAMRRALKMSLESTYWDVSGL
jgi:hypothetical protein